MRLHREQQDQNLERKRNSNARTREAWSYMSCPGETSWGSVRSELATLPYFKDPWPWGLKPLDVCTKIKGQLKVRDRRGKSG